MDHNPLSENTTPKKHNFRPVLPDKQEEVDPNRLQTIVESTSSV